MLSHARVKSKSVIGDLVWVAGRASFCTSTGVGGSTARSGTGADDVGGGGVSCFAGGATCAAADSDFDFGSGFAGGAAGAVCFAVGSGFAGTSCFPVDAALPSLGANIVLSPDARKMPPPTRLGLLLSRALFASLNEEGCGTGCAVGFGVVAVAGGGTGAGPLEDDDVFNGLDDTGFIRSGASAVLVLSADFRAGFGVAVEVEAAGAAGVDRRPSGSTIVIGIRRRLGAGDTDAETA